ncbi:TIGR03086 family metal-binding protein [Actinomadura sp. 9N407]|uniref:TIGR03086 family metal-binding protein n=1 Tax=Actinomadura sp. 9N407 TaxID=3375154 RepID=UPI0037B53C67
MPINHIIELDRRAVRASVAVVSRVSRDDLDRATPCSEWTLGELLAHMTAQHRGFAAAARGAGEDLAIWEVSPLGADPSAAYAEAADDLLAAFAEEGVLERKFALPELAAGFAFPAAQAIGFHFIDYFVHAWDVATSIAVPFEEPDADTLEAARIIAYEVPGGSHRLRPGAAFGPVIGTPAGTSGMDEILLQLGRTPHP